MADQKPTYEELVKALSNLVDDAENHMEGDDRSMTLDVTCSRARSLLTRIRQGGESNG